MQEHAVIVDMIYYIDQILAETNTMSLTSHNTPAIKECFHAREDSPPVDGAGKQNFTQSLQNYYIYLNVLDQIY